MDLIPWDIFHPKPLWAHMEECENCCCSLKVCSIRPEQRPASLHRGHPATTREWHRAILNWLAGHQQGVHLVSPWTVPLPTHPLSPVTHYFASQGGTYWRNYTLALIFIDFTLLIWKRGVSCSALSNQLSGIVQKGFPEMFWKTGKSC